MVEEYRERYRALGLNIAYYRKLRGMTQEQLAEKDSTIKELGNCLAHELAFKDHVQIPESLHGR